MPIIKSYTDIEQSKKLIEILPLESANMFYNEEFDETYPKDIVDTKYPMMIREGQKPYLEEYGIPCWSLASLIGVLPRFIEYKGDKYYLRFMKEYVEYVNDEISITGRCLHTTGNDNLVDACYEMIIHLNELNLL